MAARHLLLCPLFFLWLRPPLTSTLFPYTTLFRSHDGVFARCAAVCRAARQRRVRERRLRSEEHTSELQSPYDLVCRLLLEKKKNHARGGRGRGLRADPELRVSRQSADTAPRFRGS